METRRFLLFGLVAVAIVSFMGIAAAAPVNAGNEQGASPDTIIGPDNSLYGLRIAFENLDESFTFNETELLEKQVQHADSRLSEFRQELSQNRTESATRVLDLYQEKINQTGSILGQYAPNGTGQLPGNFTRGLENAQEMIAKHQQVLENLMNEHPDNQGLAHAYQNSIALEQKFEHRIQEKESHGIGQSMSDNTVNGRQPSAEFPKNDSAIQKGNGPHDLAGNMTRLQEDARIHDGNGSENHTGQYPSMNQTWNADAPARNQTPGGFVSGNQTVDHRQQSAGDKSTQDNQDYGKNTHDLNQGNSGAGQNNNQGNSAGNNNGGAGNGISHNSPGQGSGQGQGTDPKPRNR